MSASKCEVFVHVQHGSGWKVSLLSFQNFKKIRNVAKTIAQQQSRQ
jgi:hypothetical protein